MSMGRWCWSTSIWTTLCLPQDEAAIRPVLREHLYEDKIAEAAAGRN